MTEKNTGNSGVAGDSSGERIQGELEQVWASYTPPEQMTLICLAGHQIQVGMGDTIQPTQFFQWFAPSISKTWDLYHSRLDSKPRQVGRRDIFEMLPKFASGPFLTDVTPSEVNTEIVDPFVSLEAQRGEHATNYTPEQTALLEKYKEVKRFRKPLHEAQKQALEDWATLKAYHVNPEGMDFINERLVALLAEEAAENQEVWSGEEEKNKKDHEKNGK